MHKIQDSSPSMKDFDHHTWPSSTKLFTYIVEVENYGEVDPSKYYTSRSS